MKKESRFIRYLKWITTFLAILCAALTSLNIGYPINVIAGFLAGAGWISVGLSWREYSIITINVVMTITYFIGVIKWALS